MSAERAIYNILSTTGGVTQLVGDRIYSAKIDQGVELPAISYDQISGVRAHNVAGAIGWVESTYQLSCWANTYIEAVDLSTAVRVAVDGVSGTKASLEIDHIFVIDEGDLANLFPGNEEMDTYGKRLDIRVVFKE